MFEKTVRVCVEGRVQGVGYRAWVERTAAGLGLQGWVRNRPDGSVEAVLQGREAAVQEMIARCETGPRHAAVSKVTVVGEVEGSFTGFEVRTTS